MTQPVLCIYRADYCADALLAAWAAHHALPGTEFIAAREGEDFALDPTCKRQIRARDILILGDIYPLPTLRAMAAEARSVLVLAPESDTTKELPSTWLTPYAEFLASTKLGELRANCGKSDRLSTCGIAWDYLHPTVSNPLPLGHRHDGDSFGGGDQGQCYLCGKDAREHEPQRTARPRIIDLIEDHALGTYGDEARAFVAVLRSYDWTDLPAMFERLDRWARCKDGSTYWEMIIREGRAILRAERQRLAREGVKP